MVWAAAPNVGVEGGAEIKDGIAVNVAVAAIKAGGCDGMGVANPQARRNNSKVERMKVFDFIC